MSSPDPHVERDMNDIIAEIDAPLSSFDGHFNCAKDEIIAVIDAQQHVYTYTDLTEILEKNRKHWGLPKNLRARSFIDRLAGVGLQVHEFNLPGTIVRRYVWGTVLPLHLAVSLRRDSYLTHHSAMYLHGLTEQAPEAIYVNAEQRGKGSYDGGLSQANIDRAFSKPPRVTSNIVKCGDQEAYLLNGKFTNKLGVIELAFGEQETLPVAGLERTLVDITVRPMYAGGTGEVLRAYTNAAPQVSINNLIAILKKLDYLYPYHQAIGFYMERAGVYGEDAVGLMEKFSKQFDFYLDYQMKETSYSKRWRLYFPKDI